MMVVDSQAIVKILSGIIRDFRPYSGYTKTPSDQVRWVFLQVGAQLGGCTYDYHGKHLWDEDVRRLPKRGFVSLFGVRHLLLHQGFC